MKFIFLLICFISSTSLEAKTLKVAFGENKPPYIFGEGGNLRGIEFDIIKEALLLSGHEMSYSKLPNKRLDLAIRPMNYDLAVGVLNHDPKLYYSTEYMQVKHYAVAKSSKRINVTSVKDLSKYSVGAWPLAWKYCGEDFKKLFSPDSEGNFPENYFEPLTLERQNRMFWIDRFDIAVTNKITFNYYKKSLANAVDTSPEVVYYDILVEDVKFVVAFRDQKIRDDFENGLSQLRRNKRYHRIFQSYVH